MDDLQKQVPHVMFRLGRQAFAVELDAIKDVAKSPDLTPVPNAEPMVRGLCVLRNHLTTALDLRLRFGLPASNDPENFTALCVDHEGDRVALIVDRVEDVAILPVLQPVKPPKDPLWQGVVTGVATRGDETIIALDIAGILDGALQPENAPEEELAS